MKDNGLDNSRSGVPIYPLHSLEPCIEIGEALKQLGGLKAPVLKSVLASHLGLAESQVLNQRIGAAKSFGILRGRAEYTLTEAAQRYFFPTEDSDKGKALIAFFGSPPVFRGMIEKFDGQKLPVASAIGNILLKEGKVPQSWSERVAGFFLKSGKYANVIDAGGHLRYDASVKQSPMAHVSKVTPTTKTNDILNTPLDFVPIDEAPAGVNAWSFSSKGKQLKVLTPEIITPELWEKLNAYVQILKPE